jgi:hypothetical protein
MTETNKALIAFMERAKRLNLPDETRVYTIIWGAGGGGGSGSTIIWDSSMQSDNPASHGRIE